jgi:hypothetical protein
MFARIRKKLAIRQYMIRLPALLQHEYGRASAHRPYTAEQVRRTIERHGLNRAFMAFAIAMFADEAGFLAHQARFGGREHYADISAELASAIGYAGSDINYSSHDTSGFGGGEHFGGGGHDGGH